MNLFNAVLNLFFPKTCGICEKICTSAICSVCKKKLEKITIPHRKCFLEITGIYYDEHMHIFKYEGLIKEKLDNINLVTKLIYVSFCRNNLF